MIVWFLRFVVALILVVGLIWWMTVNLHPVQQVQMHGQWRVSQPTVVISHTPLVRTEKKK